MPNGSRDIGAFLREQVVPQGAARHALVVGIESYRDGRLNLRCARADAQVVYDLMVDPECGMFPPENVCLLLDEEATRQNVWRALAALHRSAGPDDTVWIYYAGHAAPEESSFYWVTHDSDVDDLYGTGLSNDQIAGVLNDIQARRLVVILDCCHAAATSIQKNPTRALPSAEEVFASYRGEGRVTLSSSDGKEKSVELADVGHGAFTHFLHKGLRGDADADGDGVVTADELWTYLHRKVTEASRKAGNPQTPMLIGQMSHEFPLTLNRAAAGRKKEVARAIEGLVGLRDDQLTTGEARFCLELLRDGPKTPAEEELSRLLEAAAEKPPEARLLKVLIAAAHGARAPEPRQEPPQPPPLEPVRDDIPVAQKAPETAAAEEPSPLEKAPDEPLPLEERGPEAAQVAEFLVSQEPEAGPWYGPKVAVPILPDEEEGEPVPERAAPRGRRRRGVKVLLAIVLAIGAVGLAALGLGLAAVLGLFDDETSRDSYSWRDSTQIEKPDLPAFGDTIKKDIESKVGRPEDKIWSFTESNRARAEAGRKAAFQQMARGVATVGVRRVYVTQVDYSMVASFVSTNEALAVQRAVVPEMRSPFASSGISLIEGGPLPSVFQPGEAMAAFYLGLYVRGPLWTQAQLRVQIVQPAYPMNRVVWSGDMTHIEPARGR